MSGTLDDNGGYSSGSGDSGSDGVDLIGIGIAIGVQVVKEVVEGFWNALTGGGSDSSSDSSGE